MGAVGGGLPLLLALLAQMLPDLRATTPILDIGEMLLLRFTIGHLLDW